MKRILILFVTVIALIGAGLFTFASSASADDSITVTSNKYINSFPSNLKFQLDAQSSAGKITQIALVIQLDGVPSSARQLPDFTPDQKAQAVYTYDLGRNYLPPGVTGQFWWTLEDEKGNQKETDKQSFRVDDASKTWKKLSNNKLAVYWYSGSDSFGKTVFDRGVEAMKYLEQDTDVAVDRPVQIFLYGRRSDYFTARGPSTQSWEGGVTFADYNVVMIDSESGLDYTKSATAHELTHVIIHRRISGPLGDLSMPHWMDEGLAVYYESYPNPVDLQFSLPVKRAIQNDTLPPLRTYSGSFPADSAAANLAYGVSYSVVEYIIRHYGREKLAQLLQEFKKGGFYDDILQKVLGVNTDGLEAEWRKDVGAKPRAVVTRSNAPATAFPTFGLSTDNSVPRSVTPGAPATPQVVAVKATPAPAAPTTAPNSPSNPVSELCGGIFGLIGLGIVGLTRQYRQSRARV